MGFYLRPMLQLNCPTSITPSIQCSMSPLLCPPPPPHQGFRSSPVIGLHRMVDHCACAYMFTDDWVGGDPLDTRIGPEHFLCCLLSKVNIILEPRPEQCIKNDSLKKCALAGHRKKKFFLRKKFF